MSDIHKFVDLNLEFESDEKWYTDTTIRYYTTISDV
jgi:hypothetical protein